MTKFPVKGHFLHPLAKSFSEARIWHDAATTRCGITSSGTPAGMDHRDRGERRADHRLRILRPSLGLDGQEPPRDRQLFSIYVAAEHYGAGVGQALFDATADGGPAVLWVAKDNPRAVAFYRRNGFDFDGTEQADPGAPKIIDARMVR
jgi:ribosomal protein S18 acetylase RimI-like enzyme